MINVARVFLVSMLVVALRLVHKVVAHLRARDIHRETRAYEAAEGASVQDFELMVERLRRSESIK